jgi:hypothetical protein
MRTWPGLFDTSNYMYASTLLLWIGSIHCLSISRVDLRTRYSLGYRIVIRTHHRALISMEKRKQLDRLTGQSYC